MKHQPIKSSWNPLGVFVPVVESLRSFKGNARTCILVEPLWGISYNLFVPYTSLYMLALGVDAVGIGLIATVTMSYRPFGPLRRVSSPTVLAGVDVPYF